MQELWNQILNLEEKEKSEALIMELLQKFTDSPDANYWNLAAAFEELQVTNDAIFLIAGKLPIFSIDKQLIFSILIKASEKGIPFDLIENLLKPKPINIMNLFPLDLASLWTDRLALEFWATQNHAICPDFQSIHWSSPQVFMDSCEISDDIFRRAVIKEQFNFLWACNARIGTFRATPELIKALPTNNFLIKNADYIVCYIKDPTVGKLRRKARGLAKERTLVLLKHIEKTKGKNISKTKKNEAIRYVGELFGIGIKERTVRDHLEGIPQTGKPGRPKKGTEKTKERKKEN